ncbi:MAG: hypothetical protein HC877_09710 [Thioploca sp.]|nr:hypothetical protein [Thioploca sp.]
MLGGQGQIWMDEFKLEIVSLEILLTDLNDKLPEYPVNMNFEEEEKDST